MREVEEIGGGHNLKNVGEADEGGVIIWKSSAKPTRGGHNLKLEIKQVTNWGGGHYEKRELLKMKTKILAASFQIFMSMFSKSISDTLGMKLNFFNCFIFNAQTLEPIWIHRSFNT